MLKGRNNTRRMLLLTEGHLGVFTSKTAVSLIRYCRGEVVGIVDSKHAGERLEDIIGFGEGVPIFGSVEDALGQKPDTLVIGVAPVGGGLEAKWADLVLAGLQYGLDVLSGLHVALAEDARFADAAAISGAKIVDVRMPPDDLPVSMMKAADSRALRILTVATDCTSGKMITTLELTLAAREAGFDARFAATGQTGIMIAGKGIAVDHCVSDFTAGAAEKLVLDDADADMLFIEGQGSIVHPGYSGVTLSLMHGSLPDAMIMCHVPTHKTVEKYAREVPLPPLADMIVLSETVMKPVFPSKVVGVSLNTGEMPETEARKAVDEAAAETGLPATDPVRFGVGPLFDAVKEVYDEIADRIGQTDTLPSI